MFMYLCVNISSNIHTHTHIYTYTVGTENIVYCPGCSWFYNEKCRSQWVEPLLAWCVSPELRKVCLGFSVFIAKIRCTLGCKHSFEHLLCISVGGPEGVCISLSLQTFPVTSCGSVQGFSCFCSCAVITLFIAISYDILSNLIKRQFPKSGISGAKNIFKIFNFWTWKILFYIDPKKV